MAETVITAEACDVCGAEVRDESIFCYNCGGRVKNEAPVGDVDNAVTKVETAPSPRPPLRSAASLRKQRRASNRQPVEIVWEPARGASIGFVITTIVLVAGSLVLLLLALYLH